MNRTERQPRVHLIKRRDTTSTASCTATPSIDPVTESLLRYMASKSTLSRRIRYERQLRNPSTITKDTYWALYQTAQELRKEGSAFHALKLEEIRRLMRLAPPSVRTSFQFKDPI